MSQKSYTIIIASNHHGKTMQVSVRASWIKAFASLAFLVFLLTATASLDYVGLLLKAKENVGLRAENLAMKRQFQVVEEKLSSLESSIDRIQNFTRKLNLITNVEDEERILKLALSPSASRAGEIMDTTGGTSGVTRIPSSELLIRDPEMMVQPQMAPKEGEVSTYKDNIRDFTTLSVRVDRALRATQLREQGVLQLWDGLSERQNLLTSTPSVKPARGWFTSRFGYRIDPFTNRPEMHAGLDLAAPSGTPVMAPADGIVSYVGHEGGYGKLVSIDHGYGVVTRYGHNSRVFVEQGQKVRRWDVISAVGSTGRSTGAHLHYEVRIHGIAVDPMNYILNE